MAQLLLRANIARVINCPGIIICDLYSGYSQLYCHSHGHGHSQGYGNHVGNGDGRLFGFMDENRTGQLINLKQSVLTV